MASRQLPTLQERLQRTSTSERIGLVIGILIVVASLVVFFLFERQPAVNYIRKSDAGIAILASIMFATCIFPLFGYGVVSMICGYVYGIPKGLYRLALHGYIRRKFKDNLEFQEMSNAVSKNGLFILLLIRLSSFPFAVLNAYFGAMTQLPYWKFILATTLSTPRLFLPIFIGHNISTLSDPEIKGKDRILKWAGNLLGIVLALAVGWYIYRHTTRRIQRINAGLSAEENEMDCAGDEQGYQRQHPAVPYPQQHPFQQMPPNYPHQYSQLPHQYMPNQQGGYQHGEYQQQQQQQQYSNYHPWDNRRDNSRDNSRHGGAATAVVMADEGGNQSIYRTPSPVSTQSRSAETIAVAVEDFKSDRQQQQQQQPRPMDQRNL
ncbi:Tlg2-vesicle protein [Mortierella alpina]|uniref:Golgi apparatus membrane protein TVP38 n=1 Tax=Mortierella alpina TaxID=64518 RepID=A0A9P6LX20_MORAP|nr:Tlg2-vesicle protein [Mortierella alpina]